ncbi:exodeoxyribonuclease V subunit alpha [Antrihabitans sp. YC3-6]|uniref:RecBCD enzyme subunit RecD n=1 Tax=Antrihabitans stalagmiti TaxID=2799499 RepID=A0A934NW25_9NOCA|nr:exodeoxyribonuclease V subunit alpha [Antrihabitans stalagmiti]MBJ8342639.1 exodeoxyribonuclease V subunit alpha [Antrihabitans stalagmiti]
MTDARLVQRAKGLLAVFNEAGVLEAADVHVAARLQKLSGENSENVLLAAAFAVRAVRMGSVCVEIERLREVSVDAAETDLDALPWPQAAELSAELRRSPLVLGRADSPLRPLRLVDTDDGELLYLDRYFRQEQTIRQVLDERSQRIPAFDDVALEAGLREFFVDAEDATRPSVAPDRQRIAAALAVAQWTTVIAGGPGTGKTHAVARILALLFAQHGPGLRVGLAAPTGKAAAQLEESVNAQAEVLGLPPGLTAMTLHRLLGWKPGSASRFRHGATNKLPYDVIVVDETSMVSLTMMCRLLEAVRPDARLLLVGDPDQLTSVDAGAVLADLVARPVAAVANPVFDQLVGADLAAADDPLEAALSPAERHRLAGGVVRLSRGRRFGGAIAELAVAIRQGREDAVLELLHSGVPEISFAAPDELDGLRTDLVDAAAAVTTAALDGDAIGALEAIKAHRLLCAHHDGPYGVTHWARQALDWVGAANGRPIDPTRWHAGQPLLVTANDHEARIYNGDTGVIVADGPDNLMAAFQRGQDAILLHPTRLPAFQTVYAMTIHKSQGSQYDTVSVLLPAEASALLTRELLYTAVTRARSHVRVIGTEESVLAGVRRQVLRASGLRRVFTN